MSSLDTAVLQIHYKAWQEIDLSFIAESLDGDYDCNNLESVSVEGYDVIVKTDDGKEHRLEQIIPDLVLETDQPQRLELWNLHHYDEFDFPKHKRYVRVQTVSQGIKGNPVLDVSPS